MRTLECTYTYKPVWCSFVVACPFVRRHEHACVSANSREERDTPATTCTLVSISLLQRLGVAEVSMVCDSAMYQQLQKERTALTWNFLP